MRIVSSTPLSEALLGHAYMGSKYVSAEQNHQGKLILVVDDDADMRSLLCDALNDIGLQVAQAADGTEAIEKSKSLRPQLVLTDLRMPTGGFDYLKQLRAQVPSCPVVLLTAFGNHKAKAEAAACGVSACLAKPIKLSDLQRAVLAVLDGEGAPSH